MVEVCMERRFWLVFVRFLSFRNTYFVNFDLFCYFLKKRI